MQDLLNFDGRDSLEGENSMFDDDPIACIKEMLLEADQLPVVMDEVPLLRCHVQALEWAIKVRPLLPSNFLVIFNDYEANHQNIESLDKSSLIKFSELQKFQKEIMKYVISFSANAKMYFYFVSIIKNPLSAYFQLGSEAHCNQMIVC